MLCCTIHPIIGCPLWFGWLDTLHLRGIGPCFCFFSFRGTASMQCAHVPVASRTQNTGQKKRGSGFLSQPAALFSSSQLGSVTQTSAAEHTRNVERKKKWSGVCLLPACPPSSGRSSGPISRAAAATIAASGSVTLARVSFGLGFRDPAFGHPEAGGAQKHLMELMETRVSRIGGLADLSYGSDLQSTEEGDPSRSRGPAGFGSGVPYDGTPAVLDWKAERLMCGLGHVGLTPSSGCRGAAVAAVRVCVCVRGKHWPLQSSRNWRIVFLVFFFFGSRGRMEGQRGGNQWQAGSGLGGRPRGRI